MSAGPGPFAAVLPRSRPPERFTRTFNVGFIRAEVVGYDDLIAAGGLTEARKLGRLRREGKEYIVQDGDVINFLFNV